MDRFYQTTQAQKRIHDIRECAVAGIPILLIGKTGTGKTAAAIEALKNHNNFPEPIRFNFSSETQVHHLLGHISLGNELTFVYGKYTDAYKNGKAIILDELNLASEDVLHCIEASLDSGFLSIDSTQGFEQIPMHHKFVLVATENPPYENFISKRNILTNKFKSKFKIIEFEEFNKDELMVISKNTGNGNLIPDLIIENFINFHIDISKATFSDRPFTIRDLKAVLCSYDPLEGLDTAIFRQYCSYDSKLCIEVMKKYGFEPKQYINFDLPKNIFKNDSIERVMYLASHFVKQKQPILIVGENGCGKTFAAKLISKLVTKEDPALIFCNPETTIADLIGNYIAVERNDGKIPIEWYDSPMIRALNEGEGKPVILDQIDMTPAQVIERLNPLLDSFTRDEFEVTESSEPRILKIQKNFRIIATATLSNLDQISPALLNRFAIIYMNNQIEKLDIEKGVNLYFSVSGNENLLDMMEDVVMKLKNYNMATIVKFFNAFNIIHAKYPSVNIRIVYDYLIQILIDQKVPTFDEMFIREILKASRDTSKFHFRSIQAITDVICTLKILRDIGQPVILQSTTGLGKTSCAMAFADIFSKGNQINAKKLSFNKETHISDLYGSLTVKNGKLGNNCGPLLEALQDGLVFVADELNLAESTIIESLVTALEARNITCCMPTVTNPVTINDGFFFIGCQNDSSMFGRKHLPQSFCRKVTVLEYPYPKGNQLTNLLERIMIDEGMNEAEKIKDVTNFTYNLLGSINSSQILKYHPWSFREVRRFIRRILYTYKSQDINIPAIYIAEIQAALMIKSTSDNNKETIEEIIDVIRKGTSRNKDEVTQIIRDILGSNVTVSKKGTRTQISKGKVSIFFNKENNYSDIKENIKSFWNAVFIIKMAPNEPLLIYGDSGFKTFLAEFISENPCVAPLNRDTTTSELIGQVSLVNSQSFKANLIQVLMMMSPPEIMQSLKKIMESLTEINENEFTSITNKLISLRLFLQDVITQIRRNVLYTNQNESTSIIHDHTTMFLPGLITQQIFQKKTTILKNFTAPAVAVIERLNELLAIEPELTLNEDYTSTITPQNNNIIRIPNLATSGKQEYRVIAICHEKNIRQLSEAMKSRLTMVRVDPYTKEEVEILHPLLSIICDPDQNNFAQLNLIKEVSDRIRVNSKNSTEEEAIKTARDFVTGLPKIRCNQESMNFNPFKFDGVNIQSEFYPLLLTPKLTRKPESSVIFTPQMQRITQAAFVSTITNIPLILQGPNGSGKSTAIMYALSTIGINESDVKVIQLSRSTTVENLFGSNGIKQTTSGVTFEFKPTEFLSAVADVGKNSPYQAVIITEMNLAQAPVLDALLPLFSYESNRNVLLPNGEAKSKRKCHLFGLSSQSFASQDIRKKAMILESEEYPDVEFKEICNQIVREHSKKNLLSQNFEAIPDIFTNLRRIGLNNNQEYTITVRLCETFLNLIPYYSFNTLLSTILEGTFSDQTLLHEIHNKFDSEEKSSEITFNPLTGKLIIEGQKVSVRDPKACQAKFRQIDSLTDDQKKLFIFLASNYSHRFPIIAEGPTASGKTHAIILFAQLVGIPLTVLQLNSESSSSLIVGGVNISSNISETYQQKIKDILDKYPQMNLYFEGIIEQEKWKISDMRAIQEKIKEIPETLINKGAKEELLTIIDESCLVLNTVETTRSPIMSAMKNGSWVLLDNVEAAPGDIIDRITPLLCENPDFNIFGDEDIRDKVHPDFRILMTYNPYGVHRLTPLSNTIRSRCFVFSMGAIDNTLLSSGIILRRLINNLPSEVVYRIARVHMIQRSSSSDIDAITGRILLRIGRAINNYKGEIDNDYIMKLVTFVYSKGLLSEPSPEIVRDYQQEIDAGKLEEFDQLTKTTSDLSKVASEYLQQVIDHMALLDFQNFENLLMNASFSSFTHINELLRQFTFQLDGQGEYGTHNAFDAVIVTYIMELIDQLLNYCTDNKISMDISFKSTQCLEHKQIIEINSKISEIVEEIETTPKELPVCFLSEESLQKYKYDMLTHKEKELVTLSLPLLARINRESFRFAFTGTFDSFYTVFVSAFSNASANVASLKEYYLLFRKYSLFYEEDRPKQLVKAMSLNEVRNMYYININFKFVKNAQKVLSFVSEISKRIKEEEKKISLNRNVKEETLLSIDKIQGIIIEKKANWNLYESIKKVIDSDKSILLGTFQFEKMQEQIEKYSNNTELEYFRQLHLDTLNEENCRWFQFIIDYSFVESLINMLDNQDSCYYAIAALPENCGKSIAVKHVLKKYIGNSNLKNTIREINKHNYVNRVFNEFEESHYIITFNRITEKINSLLNMNSKPDSSWIQIIQDNTLVSLQTKIVIPKIGMDDLIKLVINTYPETQLKIDNVIGLNKVISARKLIKIVESASTNRKSKSIKEFIKGIMDSLDKTDQELDVTDLISFEKDPKLYFDRCYNEAIFLAENPIIAKVLDNSLTNKEITLGVIYLRLFAYRSGISFTTSENSVPKKAIEYMTETFKGCIMDLKEVPYSILYPMMVEGEFGKITTMGSLLHDSFVQLLSYDNWPIIEEFLSEFLSDLIEKICKDKELKFLDNQFASANFILSPVKVFFTYASDRLKKMRNSYGKATGIKSIDQLVRETNKAIDDLIEASEKDCIEAFFASNESEKYKDVQNKFIDMSRKIKTIANNLPEINLGNDLIDVNIQKEVSKSIDLLRRASKSDHKNHIPRRQTRCNFLAITDPKKLIQIGYGKRSIKIFKQEKSSVLIYIAPTIDISILIPKSNVEILSVSVDNITEPSSDININFSLLNKSIDSFIKSYDKDIFNIDRKVKIPFEVYISEYDARSYKEIFDKPETFNDKLKEIKKYQDVKYNSCPNDPKHTKKALQELIKKLEDGAAIEKENSIIEERCKRLPMTIDIPDIGYQPINFSNYVKTDVPGFGNEERNAKSSPIIIENKGAITIAFSQVNATISNVPKGLLTNPAKIKIYVIGLLPNISIVPDNIQFPVNLEYRNKSEALYLSVQTNTLLDDYIFTGTVFVGDVSFRYNIEVQIVDPIIIIKSPGNYFSINNNGKDVFLPPVSFTNESTVLEPFIGSTKGIQARAKVLTTNKENKRYHGINVDDSNKVRIEYQYIDNPFTQFNLYFSSNIKIPIYSKTMCEKRPFIFNVFDNAKGIFKDPKDDKFKVEVGSSITPLYIYVGTINKSNEPIAISFESKYLDIFDKREENIFETKDSNLYALVRKTYIKLKQEFTHRYIDDQIIVTVEIPNAKSISCYVSFSNKSGFKLTKSGLENFSNQSINPLYYSETSQTWVDDPQANKQWFELAITETSFALRYKFSPLGYYLDYRLPKIIDLSRVHASVIGIYVGKNGDLKMTKEPNEGDVMIAAAFESKKKNQIVNWFPGREDDVNALFDRFKKDFSLFTRFKKMLEQLTQVTFMTNQKDVLNIINNRRETITRNQRGFLNFPIDINQVFNKINELQNQRYKIPTENQFESLLKITIKIAMKMKIMKHEENYLIFRNNSISVIDKFQLKEIEEKYQGVNFSKLDFVSKDFKAEKFVYEKPSLRPKDLSPLRFVKYLDDFTEQCRKLSAFICSSTPFSECKFGTILEDLTNLCEWSIDKQKYCFLSPIRKFIMSMKLLNPALQQVGINIRKLSSMLNDKADSIDLYILPSFRPYNIDHLKRQMWEKTFSIKQPSKPVEKVKKDTNPKFDLDLDYPALEMKPKRHNIANEISKASTGGYTKVDISKITMLSQWIVEQILKGVSIHDTDEEEADIGKPVIGEAKGDFCISEFITAAKPLAATIFKSLFARMEETNNSEVVLMMDISTSSQKYRHIVLAATIAHAIALSALKVRFAIVAFSDRYFHVAIKNFKDRLQLKHIQLLFDSMKAVRRVTFLSSAVRFVNMEFSEYGYDRHFIVLSDGLFLDMHEEEWKNVLSQKSTIDCLTFPELKENDLDLVEEKAKIFSTSMNNKIAFHFVREPNAVFLGSNALLAACMRITSSGPSIPPIKIVPEMPQKVNAGKLDPVSPSHQSDEDPLIFVKCAEDIPYVPENHPTVILNDSYQYITEALGEKVDVSSFDPMRKKSSSIAPFYIPNRPTQYSPSEKGSALIYMIGLIKSCITHGQEKKIYLEKKGGYIPSYSTFVVVDCSTSCFSMLGENNKSNEMVLSFLHMLAGIESHPITVIAATANGPTVLCNDMKSSLSLQKDSDVFTTLMYAMSNPSENASFVDAMEVVKELRTRQTTSEAYVFAFTDGYMSLQEKKRAQSILAALEVLSTEVIGVGVGLDPNPAVSIFKKFVWTRNPTNLPDCIQKLAQEQNVFCEIDVINYDPAPVEVVDKLPEILETNDPVFISFIEYIRNLNVSSSSTMVMYNPNVVKDGEIIASTPQPVINKGKKPISDQYPKLTREEVLNKSKYDLGRSDMKDAFKFRVMFCLFYVSSMNKGKENDLISFKILNGPNGIINEMKTLGINVDVVLNYKEAIYALSLGKYSQVWVVCGKGDKEKPPLSERPQLSTPSYLKDCSYKRDMNHMDHEYLLQFVDTLEEFRQRGGGVSFWCDDNFTFELDHFLSVAHFYSTPFVNHDDIVEIPMKYDNVFNASDFGNKSLLPGVISKRKPGTYDQRQKVKWGNITRPLPGYNIPHEIFEGDTIACATIDNISKTPFTPFAISSGGGVCSAYYLAPNDVDEGDVWIDGAATKLFMELKKSEIRRLVKNIVVFLDAPEKGILRYGSEEKYAENRIKKIEPPPMRSTQNVLFSSDRTIDVDVAFVVDATGSMFRDDNKGSKMIESAKAMIADLCNHIKSTKEKNRLGEINFGAVFFRDYAMAELQKMKAGKGKEMMFNDLLYNNKSEYINFNNSDEFLVRNQINLDVEACGGCGDGPEDWVDAFSHVNRLSWRPNATKLLVMITDSGAHGKGFNNTIFRAGTEKILNDGTKKVITEQEVVRMKALKDEIDVNEFPKLVEQLKLLASNDVNIFFISATKDSDYAFKNGLLKNYPDRLIEIYRSKFDNSMNYLKKELNTKLQEKFNNIVMSSKNNKNLAGKASSSIKLVPKKTELYKNEVSNIVQILTDIPEISVRTKETIIRCKTNEDLISLIRFRVPQMEYEIIKNIYNYNAFPSNFVYDLTQEERTLSRILNSSPKKLQGSINELYISLAHEMHVKERLEEFVKMKLPMRKGILHRKEEEEEKETDDTFEIQLKSLVRDITNCLDNISPEESDYIRNARSYKELITNIRFDLSPERIDTIIANKVDINIEPITVAAQLAVRIFVDRLPNGPEMRPTLSNLSVPELFTKIGSQIKEAKGVDKTIVLQFEFFSQLRDTEFDNDNSLIAESDNINEIAAKVNFMVSQKHRGAYSRVYNENSFRSAPRLIDVSGIEDDLELINASEEPIDFFTGLVVIPEDKVKKMVREKANEIRGFDIDQ